MIESYINHENLEVARQSLEVASASAGWSFSSMWAMWVSAIGALATTGVAGFALSSWKSQEKAKVKMEFKKAILRLNHAISTMPSKWNFVHINAARSLLGLGVEVQESNSHILSILDKYNETITAWRNVSDCWIMCESTFSNTDIHAKFTELEQLYSEYIEGNKEKNNIQSKLKEILDTKFIF
ncbi:TPA: hypothetical protein ACWX5G_003417 [Enterobacter cloacae]|uniref:hypothetical protein n=1 Tax=Enterobacter cloacae TaxID=550 RepID=UPI00375539A3